MFLLLHHKVSMHVNRYLLHLVQMTFLVYLIAAAWEKQKQWTAINCQYFLGNIVKIWYLNGNQGVEQRCVFYSQNMLHSLGCYFTSVVNFKPDYHPSVFWTTGLLLMLFVCNNHLEIFFSLQVDLLVKYIKVVWNEGVCRILSKTNETKPHQGWWKKTTLSSMKLEFRS